MHSVPARGESGDRCDQHLSGDPGDSNFTSGEFWRQCSRLSEEYRSNVGASLGESESQGALGERAGGRLELVDE